MAPKGLLFWQKSPGAYIAVCEVRLSKQQNELEEFIYIYLYLVVQEWHWLIFKLVRTVASPTDWHPHTDVHHDLSERWYKNSVSCRCRNVWLLNRDPFLNTENGCALRTSIAHERLRIAKLFILLFLPSSPVLWLSSWALTFILELKAKLSSTQSAWAVCQARWGGTASVSDWHRSTCAHHHCCLSPLRCSYKALGWSKSMAFPCWGGHKDGLPLLSICLNCYDCGLQCSLGRLSLVLLNPVNGRPSCKTCLLAVRFGWR